MKRNKRYRKNKGEIKKAKELREFEKETLRLMKIQTMLIIVQILMTLIREWA